MVLTRNLYGPESDRKPGIQDSGIGMDAGLYKSIVRFIQNIIRKSYICVEYFPHMRSRFGMKLFVSATHILLGGVGLGD